MLCRGLLVGELPGAWTDSDTDFGRSAAVGVSNNNHYLFVSLFVIFNHRVIRLSRGYSVVWRHLIVAINADNGVWLLAIDSAFVITARRCDVSRPLSTSGQLSFRLYHVSSCVAKIWFFVFSVSACSRGAHFNVLACRVVVVVVFFRASHEVGGV